VPEQTSLAEYRSALETQLATGLSTEHTHRAALQRLVEQLTGLGVTNEPKRSACGAPDFTVWKAEGYGPMTVGHIEAKDVGENLSEVERSEQLTRYRAALPNLVLTDYLEFRWFIDGQPRVVTRVAELDSRGSVTRLKSGESDFLRELDAFVNRRPRQINRPQDLAERMARLTHLIRDVIVESFAQGIETKLVKDLRKAFTDVLIPDLSVNDFADMFAQTLAYGLFTARANHDGNEPFRRHDAAYEIPRSNPFLRKLFAAITGPELDEEPYVGLVDDLTQLLDASNMVSIFAEFGTRGPREDPVVHFYETFLSAYDPTVREMRGVYYTPEPVVSYIVRSVDRLLRQSFHCPAGLADQGVVTFKTDGKDDREVTTPRVLVLDPACGTGTFLYSVVDLIRQQFEDRDDAGKWAAFAREQLIPRLFGFEILMAPYTVAHLKLALQLAGQDLPVSKRADWSYEFDSAERLSIYLTNTLEEALKKSEVLLGAYISEEANAAADIKRELPILVVLGNPPYSGHSANRGDWITDLVRDYSRGVPGMDKPAQAKWLQDDYVKFLRFGQWRIERSGSGVLAFITNHAYLDNPTFRGMRKELMKTFDDIYVLNLHGNTNRKEVAPDGTEDKNVFDIRQGVAIGLFIRSTGSDEPARVHHADLWGNRIAKYDWLSGNDVDTTDWTQLEPRGPQYLFIPEDHDLRDEYERGWRLPEIMSLGGDPAAGVVTTHDSFAISWTKEDAISKVERFLATKDEASARELWKLCGQSQWNYDRAKTRLSTGEWRKNVVPILYRPFDCRATVWDSDVAVHRRERVMQHMLAGPNIGLLTTRSVEIAQGFQHVFCTTTVASHHSVSSKEVNFLFPLYLYPEGLEEGRRIPNIAPAFIEALQAALGLRFVADGRGDLATTIGPEDILDYVYAILHSPGYRERYDEFLRKDFPRIPLVTDLAILQELAPLGRELLGLHQLHIEPVGPAMTNFPVPGSNVVERGYPKFVESPVVDDHSSDGRIYINEQQYFGRVPKAVWDCEIGGYKVCDRWLRDRRGMPLTHRDLTTYERIILAIDWTTKVVESISRVTSWPPAGADRMLADLHPAPTPRSDVPL
jgi:predicted helicase